MTDEPASTPPTSFDWDAYHAEVRERARLTAEVRPADKQALFDVLDAAGIALVTVHFDGYGDSGQIEGIEVEGASSALPDASIPFVEITADASALNRVMLPVSEVIECMVYAFLEQTHNGWEDNEGAYGDFIFDVLNRKIKLEYNERVSDTVYSEHVF
jgi:hypothetical protein